MAVLLWALVLTFCLAAFAGLSACETTGSSSSDTSKEEIEGTIEQCNSLYTKYAFCTEGCDRGGLCLEGCVTTWYGDFLDCCTEFEADVTCLAECLDTGEGCFDDCEPLAHDDRRACYLDFAQCAQQCPPPLAQRDTPLESDS